MRRISQGLHLLGVSFQLIRRAPQLLLLPAMSLLLILVTGAAAIGGFALLAGVSGGAKTAGWIVVIALGFTLCSFIATVFNGATIIAATRVMAGEPARIGSSIAAAWKHRRALILWALISASVGIMLRATSGRGMLGRVVSDFAGVAWGFITYLIVPVIVFEDRGPLRAIARSTELYQRRWGEEMTGSFGLSLILLLISSPLVILGVIVTALAPPVGLVYFAVLVLVLVLGNTALIGCFTAALYGFAAEGRTGGGFSGGDFGAGPGPAPQPQGGFSIAPPAPVMYSQAGQPPCVACGAPGQPGAFCAHCGSPRMSAVGAARGPQGETVVVAAPWQPHSN